MKKLLALCFLFFVTACTEKLNTPFKVPTESRGANGVSIVGPKGADTSVTFGGVNLEVAETGPIVFDTIPICEAAKIVLGDGLSLAYTCNAQGTISMAYPDGGAQRVLNGFVGSARRAGVVVLVRDSVVILTKGRVGETGHANQGPPPTGLPSAEEVEGGFISGPLPKEFKARIKNKRATLGGVVVRQVPTDVPRFDAESIADSLALDVDIAELNGRIVVMGSSSDVGVLFAALAVGDVVTFPVTVATMNEDTVTVLTDLYPDVVIRHDPASRTLWLSGGREVVVRAFEDIRTTLPRLGDIEVRVTFVSYSKNTGADLGVDGDLAFDLASGRIGTGTVFNGYDFDIRLQHLEESGSGKVLSKPRLRTTNGKAATFKNGESVPIRSSVNTETGAESFEYRDTGVVLHVTPRRVAGGLIVLNVRAEVSTATSDGVGGNPVFRVREVSTEVVVSAGDVVSLSGLDSETGDVSNRKRFLFLGGSKKSDSTTSLAFFVSAS